MKPFTLTLTVVALWGALATAQTPYRAPAGMSKWEKIKHLIRSDATSSYTEESAQAGYGGYHPQIVTRGPITSAYSMIRHDRAAMPLPGPLPGPAGKPELPIGPGEKRPGFLPPQVPN